LEAPRKTIKTSVKTATPKAMNWSKDLLNMKLKYAKTMFNSDSSCHVFLKLIWKKKRQQRWTAFWRINSQGSQRGSMIHIHMLVSILGTLNSKLKMIWNVYLAWLARTKVSTRPEKTHSEFLALSAKIEHVTGTCVCPYF
jgi:hypothetical protein